MSPPSTLQPSSSPNLHDPIDVARDASDAIQTFLPPVQAFADVIPCVGGVIKSAVGGMLGILQLVDRWAQNKDEIEQLTSRLHVLRRFIDNAPIARTIIEENLRLRLLSALETATSQLEKVEERIRASPSVTHDIDQCVKRINNHLLEYMVFSLMHIQNDVLDIKASADDIVISHVKQLQFIDKLMETGGTGQLPDTVSCGYVILVDATGREHTMLLDQCQYLDVRKTRINPLTKLNIIWFQQLNAMLHACLFQCRPDEAEIQRWYIERNLYNFVIYDSTHSEMIQLTKESDTWTNLESGTRIVMSHFRRSG
ncbi:hypothetical protein JVU11DRAFT_6104 [Chiua virens]|nr:hypothetical protein JVU11DRAFT_6104 [Chiua virens]